MSLEINKKKVMQKIIRDAELMVHDSFGTSQDGSNGDRSFWMIVNDASVLKIPADFHDND